MWIQGWWLLGTYLKPFSLSTLVTETGMLLSTIKDHSSQLVWPCDSTRGEQKCCVRLCVKKADFHGRSPPTPLFFSFFAIHLPPDLEDNTMAGVLEAILVQEVILRMKLLQKGGRSDGELAHNDCRVTVSALDCPPTVLFYVRNKFISCLSHCIWVFQS